MGAVLLLRDAGLLVLYLIGKLDGNNPGRGWDESQANLLYGWYTGLAYLFPLIGGFLADRFLGTHRSILLGGVLIAWATSSWASRAWASWGGPWA